MKIEVSSEIRTACPAFAGVAISAKVVNTAYNEELWQKINEFTVRYREMYTTDSIKDMTTIHATREAYKKCGKDPSRYRPSGEALCRRILRGFALYQIDTLVDLINLVSIRFGYSIGGFDADKIVGDTLILGIGKAGEPYEGIGRGELNIEGMPVYRDAAGGPARLHHTGHRPPLQSRPVPRSADVPEIRGADADAAEKNVKNTSCRDRRCFFTLS